jgi:hypothetical protein
MPFFGVELFSIDLRRKQQPQGREAPLWGMPKGHPCCFICKSLENRYTLKTGIHQSICYLEGTIGAGVYILVPNAGTGAGT